VGGETLTDGVSEAGEQKVQLARPVSALRILVAVVGGRVLHVELARLLLILARLKTVERDVSRSP